MNKEGLYAENCYASKDVSLTCIRRIQVTSYTSFNQLLVLLYQGAEKTGDTYDLTHLKHDWYDKVGLN